MSSLYPDLAGPEHNFEGVRNTFRICSWWRLVLEADQALRRSTLSKPDLQWFRFSKVSYQQVIHRAFHCMLPLYSVTWLNQVMLELMSQTYPPEPTSAVVPVNLKIPGTHAFHRLEVNMPDINVTTCLSSLFKYITKWYRHKDVFSHKVIKHL